MKPPVFSKKVHHFLFYPAFVIGAAVIVTLLLWAVYAIPVEKIRNNMSDSAKIINITPRSLWYNLKVPGEMIDKNTDARMLNIASILRVDTALNDSLLNPELVYEWWAPRSLIKSLNQDTLDHNAISTYPRFWHGYLLFLKPLLLVFNLDDIRFINFSIQLVLLLAVLYLICRRLSCREAFAYLTAVCFLNPVTSWLCMEFATNVNIMLLASFAVLLNHNKDDNKIFFITGVITITFDFITFPLITLGIPLILHIALYDRPFKKSIICVIKNSLLWLSGYSIMWSLKWTIATIITGNNVFQNAMSNIIHRSYGYLPGDLNDASEITLTNALKLNYAVIDTPVSVYYLVGFLILLLLSYFITPYRLKKNPAFFIFWGIALMPFIWFSVLINHSAVHYWFTYRILAITVFALLMSFSCLFKTKERLKNA